MKNNIYIWHILRNIRIYLDNQSCSMTNEYFIIKEADCPSGRMQATTIRDASGIIHCYVIPNLYLSAEASYTNIGCQATNKYHICQNTTKI